MHDWDTRFMRLAQHIATWSKDRSTQVGSVIVGPHREIRSTGYNGMPQGLDDTIEARHERPAKYVYFEHSERNSIYFAALNGVRIEGCTLYVTMPPCADCARGIIRTGIARVVCPPPPDEEACARAGRGNWREGCLLALEMMKEARVVVDIFDPSSSSLTGGCRPRSA
jgi:dCMP deaminase